MKYDTREAVTFLLNVHKRYGLPEAVPAWVKTADMATSYEMTFTRDGLESQIERIPDGAVVELSPFAHDDNSTTGVLLTVWKFPGASSRAGDELFDKFQRGTPDVFDAFNPHFVGSGRRPDDAWGDNEYDEEGETFAIGVVLLQQPITRKQFTAAEYRIGAAFAGIEGAVLVSATRIGSEALCSATDGYLFFSEDDGAFFGESSTPGGPEPIIDGRPLDSILAKVARFEAVGRDIDLYRRLGRRSERQDGQETVKWLVDGIIPAGTVTLMAGAQMTGKSTLATELAVAVAQDSGPRIWLGRPVIPENATGLAVILSGEDTSGIINARLAALDQEDTADRLMPYALDARTLPELCEALAKVLNLSLVIVDPARRYLVGDEDGSDSANTFFATLEALAARTGAAVVVLHHLTKNAAPTSLQAVRELVRGSGVWLDRPRVMLGMFRRRDTTVVGVAKHNIPPIFPMMEESAFTRDAMTLRHLPVAQPDTADDGAPETDGLERKALAAIDRLRADGAIIMRRGAMELWALQPAEMEGIGRNRIREAVDALIADGLVLLNPAGLEVAP